MDSKDSTNQKSWLDTPIFTSITVNWEVILFAAILIIAFLSRFYELGLRVMSHDETSHVYFSWQLFRGDGYAHSALTHGPLQFHLIALSYFLFGDSDFSARIPMALFSIATIAFAWNFRRYIGRIGALVAAALFLISPYMLYYGRYARNEAFVGLFGLITLWSILRYLDRGENRYLYFLTAATALHFASKETSFIYTAQALLFLGFLFLGRISKRLWANARFKQLFFFFFYAAAALLMVGIGLDILLPSEVAGIISATEVVEPVVAGGVEGAGENLAAISPFLLGAAGAALLSLLISLVYLVKGYGWERLGKERSFGLMVLLGTLVLPHLSAFFINLLGGDPLNYNDNDNLILLSIVVTALLAISAAIGMAWKRRPWLTSIAIFYAIFIPLFTTIFTNANGVFSGVVGSLGYWLVQQGVQRGNQPSYYYWGVQIPIYEYLVAVGSLLAARLGLSQFLLTRNNAAANSTEDVKLSDSESRRIALSLFTFWVITSLIAYTVAGEKMPWLTYHIALPMILLSGWSFGKLIKKVDWARFKETRQLLGLTLIAVSLMAGWASLSTLLGANPPFQGSEQFQLGVTYRFIFQIAVLLASLFGSISIFSDWSFKQFRLAFGVVAISGLALLTVRTSYRANFVNYDDATEYLVYAHMGRGPKEVLEQVEELSQRINDGNTMAVAYDNETSYPFWWYLRNYPNQSFYGESPGRELRDVPVIIVGDSNYGKLEPIVGNAYYQFEYIRIWWPNQDYFDFSKSSVGFDFTSETGLNADEMSNFDYLGRALKRVWGYLDTGAEREAIYDIWMNRDYNAYFQTKNQSFDLSNWSPSRTMRMYVRKDIAAQIWDFGVEPVAEIAVADPYENAGISLEANLAIGEEGIGEAQFSSPRGIAVAPNGGVYVADSNNHRIQHFDIEGNFINAWGMHGDSSSGEAPGGTFFEPWGVAVSPDGEFVYVSDTWNHRIQKFTEQGRFLREWGSFGQSDAPYSMWGPRDLVVDSDGNVLVMDTGNKRIKVYDSGGNFISQFGQFGLTLGSFDEPVSLALDQERNRIYVTDTWNQRVQVLSYVDGIISALDSWEIAGWYGQSLDNKPYISVGNDGQVYVSDPEGGRILVYGADGSFIYYWGGFDEEEVLIGIAQGLAADELGNVWVSDSQNNKIYRFVPD
jgi:predicted membrane-bound mannosyltransferase/DNA-binding beta-propeller fold protein YncE